MTWCFDLLDAYRGRYPPGKKRYVIGLATQAAGYFVFLVNPLLGLYMIYGGGALFGYPILLWLITERRR